MYQTIYQALREKLGDVFIYFCMESEEVWQEVIGKSPKSSLDVDWYFAKSLYENFPDLNLPQPFRKTYQLPISF